MVIVRSYINKKSIEIGWDGDEVKRWQWKKSKITSYLNAYESEINRDKSKFT